MKNKRYGQESDSRNSSNQRDSQNYDHSYRGDHSGFGSYQDSFDNRGSSNYGNGIDDGRIQMDRGNNSNFRNDYFGQPDFVSPDRQATYSRNSSQSWSPKSDSSESLWQSTKNFFGKGPKGFKRSDEKIREEVCEALYRDNSVDASEIEVSVKDAEVILSGTVSERRMKRSPLRDIEGMLRFKIESVTHKGLSGIPIPIRDTDEVCQEWIGCNRGGILEA